MKNFQTALRVNCSLLGKPPHHNTERYLAHEEARALSRYIARVRKFCSEVLTHGRCCTCVCLSKGPEGQSRHVPLCSSRSDPKFFLSTPTVPKVVLCWLRNTPERLRSAPRVASEGSSDSRHFTAFLPAVWIATNYCDWHFARLRMKSEERVP